MQTSTEELHMNEHMTGKNYAGDRHMTCNRNYSRMKRIWGEMISNFSLLIITISNAIEDKFELQNMLISRRNFVWSLVFQ